MTQKNMLAAPENIKCRIAEAVDAITEANAEIEQWEKDQQ